MVNGENKNLGLYVHLPFCVHHCVYCDFNVRELKHRREMEWYLRALQEEIRISANRWNKHGRIREIDAIFLGGGTPSLFSAEQMDALLSTVRLEFKVSASVEITMEANPNSVTILKLRDLHQLGINRLSLGIQSFHKKHLKTLERIHSQEQALQSVWMAKEAGFEQINLDFIFGIPDQTVEDFQSDLLEALRLNPSHLSVYQLTVGASNPLYPVLPLDDISAEMYRWAIEYLPAHEYEHYEVSAFAKPGSHCVHNLKYWKLKDFLGLGAGATSRLTDEEHPWGLHLKNVDHLETYWERIMEGGTAIEEEDSLSQQQAEKDYLLTHLRLLKGLSWEDYEKRFQKSFKLAHGKQIHSLIEQGFLDSTQKVLKLTLRGLLYLNKVLLELI